jgi:pectate lyase
MAFTDSDLLQNYFNKLIASGVNSRMGAQVRVESSVWENSHNKAIISEDSKQVGYVTVSDVSYGGSKNTAPAGNFGSSKIPYSYVLYGRNNVKKRVVGVAGQTLKF